MDNTEYKTVESMDESGSGLESRSNSDSDSDSDIDQDWKKVGEELERLSQLHSSILHRMEQLTMKTATLDGSIKNQIEECHEASLEDLDQKGEITFGQRLLRLFECSPYHAVSTKSS